MILLPTIENGAVLVDDESGGWGGKMRPALPHEVVPALIEIINDQQKRIDALESWRKNSR